MQKHYNYLTIDLDKKVYRTLNAKQGDSKSRYILVNLISNNIAYDLTGTSVKIYGKKKDTTIFFNAAPITDAKNGQFEIELTNQALAVPGYLKIEILVLGANQERLSTSYFYINVEETIIDDAAIESTNEFTALTKALSEVQDIDNKFTKVNEQFNTIESEVAIKTDKSYVDNKVQAIASGSPKGVYVSLQALKDAFPTGNTNIYVVSADGCWYYWNGSAWTKGGTYQASTFKDYKGVMTDLDNIDDKRDEGTWVIDNTKTTGTFPSEINRYSVLENRGTGQFILQTISNIGGSLKQYVRYYNGVWSSWRETTELTKTYKGSLTDSINIDEVFDEGQYYVHTNSTTGTFPVTTTSIYILDIQGIKNYTVQRIVNLMTNKEYVRSYINSKWTSWTETTAPTKTYKGTLVKSTNIDEVMTEGQYWVNTTYGYEGTLPSGLSMYSILDVQGVGSNWVVQTLTTTTGSSIKVFKRSYYNKWCDWVEITRTTTLQTIPSIWNGKKANFIGDSITAGSTSYVNKVRDILGLSVARNYGIGGGRLANTEHDSDYRPVVDRYMEMDLDADIIFMLIGTNDYASQVPIGTNDSTTTTEFKGALNVVLTGLREMYPDKLIIVATQLHRYNDNLKDIKMNDYRQATKDICDKQRILCYDLYNASGFDFAKGYSDKVLTDDGLHPNEKGHEILARKISGFINCN